MLELSRWIKIYSALLAVLSLLGCGANMENKAKEQEVLRGVNFVKSLIDRTATDPVAAMSLGSLAETGGSMIHYVAASMPENAKFTCYIENVAPKPYCVLIKPGAKPGEYIIEGYGETVDRLLATEKAVSFAPKQQ